MHVDEQKRKRVLVYSRSAIIIVHERAVRKRILFSSSCCSGVYGWLFNEYTLSYNKSKMKKNRRWKSNVLSFSQFGYTRCRLLLSNIYERQMNRPSLWSWWTNLLDEWSQGVKFLLIFSRNRMPFLNESFKVVSCTFIRRTLTRRSSGIFRPDLHVVIQPNDEKTNISIKDARRKKPSTRHSR